MPAKRRRNLAVQLPDGDKVTICDGCESWPVRASWLRRCQECGLDLCRICIPDGAELCVGCQHAVDSLSHAHPHAATPTT